MTVTDTVTDTVLEEAYDDIDVEHELDQLSRPVVDDLIDKIMAFLPVLVGHELHGYQLPLARRIVESVVVGDGDEITACACRQSGKSEVVADVVCTLMVLLPVLHRYYPVLLSKFKNGLLVGLFAPVEGQVETLFGRVVDRLTSEHAQRVLEDDDFKDKVISTRGITKGVRLERIKSQVVMMTANPRAKIESKSFHLIIIDECFPYETPVLTSEGLFPIGYIVDTSSERPWVVATQDTAGTLQWTRVKTTYKTPRHTDLVRVVHEHGTVYSTANHPFITGSKSVPAIDLMPGETLSVVPTAIESSGDSSLGKRCPVVQQAMRFQIVRSLGETQEEQPYERPRVQEAHVGDPKEDRTQASSSGRERQRFYSATANALGDVASRLGSRVCVPYWRKNSEASTVSLQDRSSEFVQNDSGGTGRVLPWNISAPGTGSSEGTVSVESRVVSVEILEPGSPEFSQFSDRADFVYTLEVEADSHSYFANGVLVGNCQETVDYVVNKSISPMRAYYAGTMVKTGTPTTTKNNFYQSLQLNKRRQTTRRGKQNHYEWNWKDVIKFNKNYHLIIKKEMLRLGEDSDEFQMSYNVKWILDRGMFVTDSVMEEMGDSSQKLVTNWHRSPVVVGIDPARKLDSTVVTVVWVDWDRPDEFGYYNHRILNWLEIKGDDWESQYYQIVNFLANYDVLGVAVDANGVGDAVAERLRLLLPRAEVFSVTSSSSEQTKRWTHLQALIQRRKIGYPAHSHAKRLRVWKSFYQQMVDLEKNYKGPNMVVAAPDEAHAHDDYPDSLALACSLTKDLISPEVSVSNNFFYSK